jgi:hypothetical protein
MKEELNIRRLGLFQKLFTGAMLGLALLIGMLLDNKQALAEEQPTMAFSLKEIDELQGMFYGFESDHGGYECGGICWRFFTFLPEHKVLVGEPAGGGPETIDCRIDDCQTYTIEEGKLMLDNGDSYCIGQRDDGTLVVNDTSMYPVEAVPEGTTLEGQYLSRGYTGLVGIQTAAASWTKYITFRSDGSFELVETSIGILDTEVSHPSGSIEGDTLSGKYTIHDNTITFHFADGTKAKYIFVLEEATDGEHPILQIGKRNYDID